MIVITTALMAEAKPLIRYFKLKHIGSKRNIRNYESDDIRLIVTGTGSTSMAIATTMTLTRLNTTPNMIVNIGVAGAKSDYAIGDMYQIASIHDVATDHFSYPDLLLQTGLPLASLETHSKPVHNPASVSADLVDMEAAGFYQAAVLFVDPSRIQSLKIVSDHMDGQRFSAELVDSLIEKKTSEIAEFIDHFRKTPPEDHTMPDTASSWLTEVAEHYNLTTTQKRELRQYIRYYLSRGNSAQSLPSYTDQAAANKTDRNRLFHELKKKLSL